jgi:cobalamin biosynthesis protein CobT
MDLEFLERVSHVSKKVSDILEESERLKKLLAQRIHKRAEKAIANSVSAADVVKMAAEDADDEADTIEGENEYVEDEQEGDHDGEEDDDEDDEEEEDEEEEDEEEEDEEEGELLYNNEPSSCWKCLFGRRG